MIRIRASRPGGGRPTTFKPAHAVSLRDYFESTVQRIDELLTSGQRENLPFPTAAAWCRKQGVNRHSLCRWAKHPEFKAAHDFCRQLQRDLNRLALEQGLKFTLMDQQ